jgi:hypothetical protein
MTPAALEPLLALQHATTADDAHNLAAAAVLAGATGEEAQQALDEWLALQGRQVQQLFADRRRPDCCAGIERDHRALPARFVERYDPSPEPIDRSIQ